MLGRILGRIGPVKKFTGKKESRASTTYSDVVISLRNIRELCIFAYVRDARLSSYF